jgi:threonine dehydrogenase-like Zn-dependent dehydrogenase
MLGTVLHGPRDVRFEEVTGPAVVEPADAVIRIAVTCVCGSDLWPYRGLQPINGPTPMGHEYCGIVEEVGRLISVAQRVDEESKGRGRLPPAWVPEMIA